jgi:uncharacterized protein YlxW (UPF0749 family)
VWDRIRAAVRSHRRGPMRSWGLLVPVVFAVVGLLATMSAQTARGTDLRSSGRSSTADVIREQQHRADLEEARVTALRRQVDALTTRSNPSSTQLRGLNAQVSRLASASGTTAVRGPAVTVKLDDAPQGSVPSGFTADDMVVHQQDVQAVVNALWTGGAEAMQIMDQRVITTSAVRCVGNTLILQGRVYSPPFRITAIGDPQRLSDALDGSPGVQLYRYYVDTFGLVYEVERRSGVRLPAFDGSLDLLHADAA